MQNLSYENEFCMQFHSHANQSHFHKNGFALRLALKQRHKGTRKWPIGHVLPQSREDKAERAVLIELHRSSDSYKSVRNFRALFTDMSCESMFFSLLFFFPLFEKEYDWSIQYIPILGSGTTVHLPLLYTCIVTCYRT